MVKTVAGVAVSLAFTAFVWYWAAGQYADAQLQTNRNFAYVQHHQNDALRSILCYLERRTLQSPTVPAAEKVKSLRTLDHIDRLAHLRRCTNLPPLHRS